MGAFMIKNIANKKPIYPVDEWKIIEEDFKLENNYRNETIFSLANGYMGMRGTFEEHYSLESGYGLEGNYINGFYESEIIKYGELAFAYPQKSQTMLNVANAKVIKLVIEDGTFSMFTGEIETYKRTLNMKNGLLIREIIWKSPKGKRVALKITRLVSLCDKYISAIRYEVTPLNFSGGISIFSQIDGNVINSTTECNARIDYGPYGRVLLTENKMISGDMSLLVQRTKNNNLKVACGIENSLTTSSCYDVKDIQSESGVGNEYWVDAHQGENIILDKFITYITSREFNENNLELEAIKVLHSSKMNGFERLLEDQKEYLNGFWLRADIRIKGDEALQQGIRYNMFQLLQSAAKDGITSLGAKGLSGEGYEGHYFWDTEMYGLPFFIYNCPEIARGLLEYRYNTLDKARDRARQMSIESGALYPWRTINGEEASAYYPAGTAQVHINADIAFAVQKYIDATQDADFTKSMGAEILIETARFWVSFGSYIDTKDGKFCINGVTGPDEFAVLVNNNAYTNLLAKENLQNACKTIEWLKDNYKEAFEVLSKKINLKEEELQEWKKAAEKMYVPYCGEKGIYPQDDSFLYKKPWDIKNTPEEKYPLLNNHHPLVVYRYQVSKQADLILALCLLNQNFSKEDIRKNFDFYETVTVHESSLSACIFSIVANSIGYHEKAYSYFMRTARLDLDDFHRDTKAGIHCANMAGTWMSIVNGFAGMNAYGDVLSFNPHLPVQWEEYSFNVSYRQRVIKVTVNNQGTTFNLIEGEELKILFKGEEKLVTKEGGYD